MLGVTNVAIHRSSALSRVAVNSSSSQLVIKG
jgi:hypothetical protein